MLKKCRTYLLLALVAFVAPLLAIEAYLRFTTEYIKPYEYIFNKDVGFVYDHNATPDRVNKLGFVDKARDMASDNRRRILVVGDSFVSGTSLASRIESEMKTLFPGQNFEAIPMAFPGVDLGNMYSYLVHYGLTFKPEAVVAVFNSSTFANNSSILEAIKLRAHPEHPMGYFFTERDGGCAAIPIAPDYQKHFLKELPPAHSRTLHTVIGDFLDKTLGWSFAYNWLKDVVSHSNETGFLRGDREYAFRYFQLSTDPRFKRLLSGWNFPEDLDVNNMFWTATDKMPGVFVEALKSTKCALIAFNELAATNGFQFLLAVTDDCSAQNELVKREFQYRSRMTERVFIDMECKNKIVSIARETGTDYIDLYETFGDKAVSMHYFNDIHWNQDGLKLAAGAIAKALARALGTGETRLMGQ